MATTTFLEAAGPSRAPAVVIHPDDPLPRTWRVVSTWTYHGQRGAWLEYVNHAGSFRSEADAHLCQVVYRATAPRHKQPGNLGVRLARYGARQLICAFWHLGSSQPLDMRGPTSTEAQRLADLDARAAHLNCSLPDLWNSDHEALDKARAVPPSITATTLTIIDELDLPFRVYNALRRNGVTTIADLLVLDNLGVLRMRDMGHKGLATIDATLARHGLMRSPGLSRPAAPITPVSVGSVRARESQRPVGPPPAPGVDRAKWIGERITAMTARESSAYLPLTRRRIAAHRAMSIVAGYTPEDAVNDGLTLPGGLLLHLEGLNAYAARAFAGEEE